MKNGHKRYQKLIRLNARFGSIFGSRFWRLQSPLFLHERTSLVRVRRSSQSDRVRRSSQSEGGRRKAEAIPIMFWTAATGFANGSRERAPDDKLRSTHPAIRCLTCCLPDGQIS